MDRKKLLITLAITLSLLLATFTLAGCDEAESPAAQAATVNGEPILEQDITDSIEAMRSQSGYTADVDWATALAGSALTPESLREQVIDSFVRNIVIEQAALEQGYQADTTAIDEQITQAKTTVGGDEQNWTDTLKRYGYKDEQAYRDMLTTSDLAEQMYDAYIVEPSAEELEQYVIDNATSIEGYTVPDDGVVVYADVPESVITQLKEQWVTANKGIRFQEYVDGLVEAADVVINPIPEDVPYNVDMSLAEDINEESESNPTAGTTSTPEAIEAALAAGLVIEDIVVGEGAEAIDGSEVAVFYTGTLADGTVFDSRQAPDDPITLTLGQGTVIKGWDAGLVGMQVGGRRLLTIPPELAYGDQELNDIPANSTLYFEVELSAATQPSAESNAGAGE
ncbi:MAG: FKBP-type peptidyl-prolyl cis-trans isomerase [Coriobacteriales bacterium]|jgi:FKBP-type peptidyl-prolyl cis-trans isomerase|nr:FKBP-type peptidyl-prolyl cis-trans isomerase [Coriobacteriales bacterium]